MGLVEDGKQALAEGIHQAQFGGTAKKAFQACFFGMLEVRAMFREDPVSAFQGWVGLRWQFFLQTRQFSLGYFLGQFALLAGQVETVDQAVGVG